MLLGEARRRERGGGWGHTGRGIRLHLLQLRRDIQTKTPTLSVSTENMTRPTPPRPAGFGEALPDRPAVEEEQGQGQGQGQEEEGGAGGGGEATAAAALAKDATVVNHRTHIMSVDAYYLRRA